ncbi:MAG: hypothetical protein MUC59_06210 [Saprospiraceae bacterium]|jgi:cytochrome c-type protein NapB|nr:hypothetical protein [Saprospiraceae bacterium]
MTNKKSSYFIIIICGVLLSSAVFIFFAALQESKRPAETLQQPGSETMALPTEAGVFRRWAMALKYKDMPEGGSRNLATYYANRAYHGAPPLIPHPLVSEQGIGGRTCLQCHENGGYTEQFSAFAPVTPHPEWLNCRQCHVPKKTEGLFAGSNFEKLQAPPLGQAAMPGSPPVIPHGLQNRENCLSCHAGPAAPIAIKTTHPERVNCRQCHVPAQQEAEVFERPGGELGSNW